MTNHAEMEKHTISVLVANKFGVLARVAGLFSGRGYNISSLTVHETDDPAYSKMTIVTSGDAAILEQIDKQLRKLIEVIKVDDLTGSGFIEREMALIKLRTCSHEQQSQIIQLVEVFDGTIVSVSKNELAVEIAGRSDRLDDFVELCGISVLSRWPVPDGSLFPAAKKTEVLHGKDLHLRTAACGNGRSLSCRA
jgi:acetolactate synthase-1/3 small subunit